LIVTLSLSAQKGEIQGFDFYESGKIEVENLHKKECVFYKRTLFYYFKF